MHPSVLSLIYIWNLRNFITGTFTRVGNTYMKSKLKMTIWWVTNNKCHLQSKSIIAAAAVDYTEYFIKTQRATKTLERKKP